MRTNLRFLLHSPLFGRIVFRDVICFSFLSSTIPDTKANCGLCFVLSFLCVFYFDKRQLLCFRVILYFRSQWLTFQTSYW